MRGCSPSCWWCNPRDRREAKLARVELAEAAEYTYDGWDEDYFSFQDDWDYVVVEVDACILTLAAQGIFVPPEVLRWA